VVVPDAGELVEQAVGARVGASLESDSLDDVSKKLRRLAVLDAVIPVREG